MAAKFKPGDTVRVRVGSPPGHFRTPAYIQGKTGVIESAARGLSESGIAGAWR